MTPTFTTGAALLGSWLADVERGEPPHRLALGEPFASIDLRPGRLVLIGGAPGAGKTAAVLQMVVDLLRLNPTARVLVASVEMSPVCLLERIVSRMANVPLSAIADRQVTTLEVQRVRSAVATLEPLLDRLAFLDAPYSLEHVASAATAFGADVLVLDYIQRFTIGDGTKPAREALETIASALRRFCDIGACVLAVAAVARQRGGAGSNYSGLGLASFRGSSELEYGADAAYLIQPGEGGLVTFGCEKNRHGPLVSVSTLFDPAVQAFAQAPQGLDAFDAVMPAKNAGR